MKSIMQTAFLRCFLAQEIVLAD